MVLATLDALGDDYEWAEREYALVRPAGSIVVLQLVLQDARAAIKRRSNRVDPQPKLVWASDCGIRVRQDDGLRWQRGQSHSKSAAVCQAGRVVGFNLKLVELPKSADAGQVNRVLSKARILCSESRHFCGGFARVKGVT